jgi:hypothetical protein
MKKEESKFYIEITESGAGQKATTEWSASKSFAEKTTELTEEKLKKLCGIIPRLTATVFEGIQSSAKKPTELDIEFSVGMTVDGNIVVVKGSANASMKITLKWQGLS